MTKLTQPIKYHGGKYYLAPLNVALMPPHLHFVETHFGGGSTLLERDPDRDWLAACAACESSNLTPLVLDADDRPCYNCKDCGAHTPRLEAKYRGSSEVANDLWQELNTFWYVLSQPDLFKDFIAVVELTPMSAAFFKRARKILDSPAQNWTQIEIAWAVFTVFRQSRQGIGEDFATLTRKRTRRNMNEQVSALLNAVEGLPRVADRMQRVVIEDALDAPVLIRRDQGKLTHFYSDPPYLMQDKDGTPVRKTKGQFAKEMTLEQHVELLEAYAGLDAGTFQLAGYRSKLYDGFAKECGWNRVEIVMDNKAASKLKATEKKPEATEVIWFNYDLQPFQDKIVKKWKGAKYFKRR